MKASIVIAVCIFVASFQSVAAQVIVRTGDTVSVKEDEVVAGNFYSFTNIFNVSGTVEGDMVVGAGRATLNGSVTEDVLVLGGGVDVHGTVGDDLRVIGGQVVIAEPVAGNVFVVGRNVNILSTATVGGDVLVYGGDLTIAGAVTGTVVGRANTLRIDGPVGKDVNVTTEQLVLGDRAAIAGGVTYVSNELLTRAQNASVTGEVVRNDMVADPGELRPTLVVVPFLMVLFSVLVWFLVGRSLLQAVVDQSLTNTLRPALLGLFGVLILPMVIAIMLVSVLGTLVGILALFVYIVLLILSLIGMGAVAGVWLQKAFNQPITSLSLATILLGTFFVAVCVLLPVVGPVVLLVLFVVTFGSLLNLMIKSKGL